MSERYPFSQIEPKWQRIWQEKKLFAASDADTVRKKLYVLDMFPYPSGAGLHVGHPEGYTATDIYCRYKRMRGFNVLHPMGWDAFGLPAEQYAIDTGTHPAVTTRKNIGTFRNQIKRFGFSYDWDREIDTTDPNYVKWTQWIFLKLHEKGLAYMSDAPVWWCPGCKTVLANEEVIEGCCERKGHAVERKTMRQWMLKITAYAERLLDELDGLNWPEHIKLMQRNWIGKSVGADVWFALSEGVGVSDSLLDGVKLRRRENKIEFKIFTTRPDTLFGATYMVLAPEHLLVELITTKEHAEKVTRYIKKSIRKSELERAQLSKEKTGVFTGAYAINPVNGQKMPVWIADYVLASYGTGAIMAVPAHDQRDLEFAFQFGLDVRVVIVPQDREISSTGMTEAYTDSGRMHDSGPFSGLPSEEAKGKITKWLNGLGVAEEAINYKLRDWLFSRQRYWGEPIPIIHCKSCGVVPVAESQLPVLLPDMDDFKPSGGSEPPLSKAKDWLKTSCPKCKSDAVRETNTMPQWAGSCWYYLRYLDPKNNGRAWDSSKESYWMPVDLYVGGAEHAVLHLLYSRFWHKVLYDLKLVSTNEPFQRLINQGLILGEDGEKMSKSRGNVVNPDEVIDRYGADSFRLYEMFMGPLEAVKPWSTRSIEGVARFLQRLWNLTIMEDGGINPAIQECSVSGELNVILNHAVREVTDDTENLRFNTAISQMMVFLNALSDQAIVPRKALEVLVLLLSPYAPHMSEEIWQRLGHEKSLAYELWPSFDPKALELSEVTWVIQVNGKVRARLSLPSDATNDQLRKAVLAEENIRRFIEDRPVKQFVIVPKKLVNIVV